MAKISDQTITHNLGGLSERQGEDFTACKIGRWLPERIFLTFVKLEQRLKVT